MVTKKEQKGSKTHFTCVYRNVSWNTTDEEQGGYEVKIPQGLDAAADISSKMASYVGQVSDCQLHSAISPLDVAHFHALDHEVEKH